MERKSVEKYAKTAERDVKFVDEAIQNGAYLSFEEWHDFIFKSEMSAFKSSEMAKYETVRPQVAEIAKIEAFIMSSIINAQVRGFNDSSAQKVVKTVIKRFNKMLKFLEGMRFARTDKDGTIFYCVESYDFSDKIEKGIVDRNSFCSFLMSLWAMGLKELRMFNKESFRFLESHLVNEVNVINMGKRPAPYFGCVRSNTLECVLYSRTDYETARKAPVVAANAKSTQLKIAK